MHFEADPKNFNLNPYFSSIHIDQNFLLQRRESISKKLILEVY